MGLDPRVRYSEPFLEAVKPVIKLLYNTFRMAAVGTVGRSAQAQATSVDTIRWFVRLSADQPIKDSIPVLVHSSRYDVGTVDEVLRQEKFLGPVVWKTRPLDSDDWKPIPDGYKEADLGKLLVNTGNYFPSFSGWTYRTVPRGIHTHPEFSSALSGVGDKRVFESYSSFAPPKWIEGMDKPTALLVAGIIADH